VYLKPLKCTQYAKDLKIVDVLGASWSIWDGIGDDLEKMNFERFWRCME
jgi:hypothetical protein